MEIDVMDYVSLEDIKGACLSEIRSKVIESLRYMSADDIIANASYNIVFEMVSEMLEKNEEEVKKLLLDKTVDIINNLSSYCVFRDSRDEYTKKDSLGQTYLNEAVANNKNIIEDKVKELIRKRLQNKTLTRKSRQTWFKVYGIE